MKFFKSKISRRIIKLLWTVGGLIGFTILAQYIYESCSSPIPEITVRYDISFKANQTIIDLDIYNSGDYDLYQLNFNLTFLKKVSYSVYPNKYNYDCKLEGTKFYFYLYSKFMKGENLNFRFSSQGENTIIDKDNLDRRIKARHIVNKEVTARLVKPALERTMSLFIILGFSFLTVLIIILVLLVVMFIKFKNSSKRTIQKGKE